MSSRRWPRILVVASCVLPIQLGIPASLLAQAWLPAKGEGNYSISYQNLFVRNHLFSDGSRLDLGHIRASGLVQDFDYGLSDRIAVDVSLPYVTSKYYGPLPHRPADRPDIDNGSYHGTFQDFRFGLRYNLRTHPLVITPFIEGIVPSHRYEYFAHSAVGSDLKEFLIGMNVGRRLDPILPKAYFQARYSFAVVERTIGICPLRERLESELGYFVTKRLSVSALESLQVTHHGLPIAAILADPTGRTFPFHDKIADIGLLNVGMGASLAVSRSVELFASAVTSVWGRDGHALHDGLTFGINWNFRTRRYVRQAFARGGTENARCDSVVCRKCQKIFETPGSTAPALPSRIASGR